MKVENREQEGGRRRNSPESIWWGWGWGWGGLRVSSCSPSTAHMLSSVPPPLLTSFGWRILLSPGAAIKGAHCWAVWNNRRPLGRPGGSASRGGESDAPQSHLRPPEPQSDSSCYCCSSASHPASRVILVLLR